jgi:hypothetical protein
VAICITVARDALNDQTLLLNLNVGLMTRTHTTVLPSLPSLPLVLGLTVNKVLTSSAVVTPPCCSMPASSCCRKAAACRS